ncbi:UNVERIFIED_CONTAM: hypothetical protein GTU68_056731 [Idotea baltica]|nr:hypothetical protein [Idotea baltica]
MIAAQVLGIAKLIIIGCVLFGINLWDWMGVLTPPWYTWLSQNKIYGCMMIFFLANALEGQLISTGAFEVSYNGMLACILQIIVLIFFFVFLPQ